MIKRLKKSPQNVGTFNISIKRLFKELKGFKRLILVSIIFAILGTFLSVIAPNMLSNLTDEIGKELKVDHGNLDYLIKETEDVDKTIIINDVKISLKDQQEFKNILNNIDDTSSNLEIYSKVDDMPESVKKVIMPEMDMNKIKKTTLILVVIYVISAVCMYVQAENMADVTNGLAKKLRMRISKKINNLHFRYFDKHSVGDILSRTTNDIDTIAQSMNQAFENLFTSIILVVGTVIMMFVTNWIMAITAILSTILGIVLAEELLRKSQKYFVSRQKELGTLNEHIEETYSNIRFIKAYNGKKTAFDKFEKLNKKMYQANRKSQFLSGMMQPVMEFIGNFGYVAVCIVGAILTMNGMTSFGVIIAFIAYIELFTSPLTQIAQSTTFLQSSAAASFRVFEFLDERELKNEEDIINTLEKEKTRGDIEFNNVDFRYYYSKEPTIKNASFKIKSGEKVAIIGPVGSGKTTLMKNLLKFNEIDAGDITIDGVSIKSLKRSNIHKVCTFVFQEPWIFTGTIKENIVYNRKNVSKEQIDKVCKELGLDVLIQKLPKGYNTKISDKYNLSASEKQLIAIARGILEETPIFILDEATSNLDMEAEKKVYEAISNISKVKTLIVISHRDSVVNYVDRIIKIKDGKIIKK